ncbi:Alkaline phosphatase synthesis sensor protein PhoR (plasmid) [Variovorax sp. WDL1]|uniref:sensor histidine kinase n=2 Tax=Variovorax TaxID=34072 RepID=UPI000839AE37|nr:HAMP domain-containing sensor histidine kinase [Variovorax sp. WDL1]PNG48895.1 Alkaline phosphatase synthesis sensor protein PhoR [Variovorax sp. B2]PNG49402.1 Alkaline phosphatase synthesis sensor protein PhoR [Variovorax sp. B4]VTV18293.1 Alkaline phosphatase synthesis sensor protein PhoR [Variovorax sp. WDL1]
MSEVPDVHRCAERPIIATVTAPGRQEVAGDTETGSAVPRSDFIRQSLMNRYVWESRRRMPAGLLICFAMAAMAVGAGIPYWQALLWLGLVLLGNGVRFAAERKCSRSLLEASAQTRTEYLKRFAPIYPFVATVWGCSTLLFFGRTSSLHQFASWFLVARMLYAPMPTFSLIPIIFRLYASFFFVSTLLCISYLVWGDSSRTALLWVIPVGLAQLILTLRVSRDTHRAQAEQYGLIFDLAAQKHAADDKVKSKNRSFAAAAHDMRQPVIALSLYAEHLESHPESHVEVGPKIARASAAVSKLFNSLFDLAHFDTCEVKLSVEPVRISEVIAGLVETQKQEAEAAGIELRVRVKDALLQTDPTRLRRMIANVISNSIRYSKPGTKILLASRVHRGKLRVEVWDQGIGIAPANLPHVFSEFYRVESSASLAPEGMGIGLSMVARLADALNTKITITSVEGRGTRVTMDISDVDPDAARRRH